jgi:lipid A 3-O-deacylase
MRIILLVLLVFLTFEVYSQGKKGFQVLIGTDNDILGASNKDENYTGGLRIEALTPQVGNFWQPYIRFKDAGHLNIQRFAVVFTAYTPQDLSSSSVVKGDRPYASLSCISIGNTSWSGNNKWMIQSDLLLGALGYSMLGSAQAFIHRNHWFGSTRPVPQGWDNQIGYNGAFVINYNTRVQRAFKSRGPNTSGIDWAQLNWIGKVDFGTYMVNIQSGFRLNFLNIHSSILHDYNPDLPTFNPQVFTVEPKKFRFNFFVEPHIRTALYNATLEGLIFHDKSIYTIEPSKVNRLLFEINAGFNLQLWDACYVRYSWFGRSQEYIGGKTFHNWGGLTIGLSPQIWNHN